MEQRRGADEGGLCLECDTVLGLRVFQVHNAGEMAIDERRIGEGPEMFGGLELGRIGWEEVEIDVIGHPQTQTGMPSCAIEDQDDLLLRSCSCLARERSELRLEERNIHARREVEQGAAGGRMDEADEIAPFVAVLDRGDGALSLGCPDPAQDGLQANPMLVHRPQFDLCFGEGCHHLAQERPQFFLNRSCATESACMWRGRGTWGE